MYRIWVDEPPLESIRPMLAGLAELIGPGASVEQLATCDAALDPGARWDAARMDQAPRLRVISRIGVGYENIDVQAATKRGIVVCYTPHGPTVSTAETSSLSSVMTFLIPSTTWSTDSSLPRLSRMKEAR